MKKVFLFIIVLCFVCGILLAVVTFSLQAKQNEAKEFDQSVQMLIAAKILDKNNRFQIIDGKEFKKAEFDSERKILIPKEKAKVATIEEIKEVAKLRIVLKLTDDQGNVSTFSNENISLDEYLALNKKEGYAHLKWKLFYEILENGSSNIESLLFPINGFGLWAPIYGYLAIAKDGNTVIGTSWYEHGETPGLGANITEAWWQNQFFGKALFQNETLALTVVKGKVNPNDPKIDHRVDGISGATFTGDGVTAAFKENMEGYRGLLIKLQGNNHG